MDNKQLTLPKFRPALDHLRILLSSLFAMNVIVCLQRLGDKKDTAA